MNEGESITGFLQRYEDLWSGGLKSVSLVAELDVDNDAAAKALKFLGIKYSFLRGGFNELSRLKLLKEYPAVFLVSTVNCIADKYDNGGVWPQLADALGIDNSPNFHTEWGEAFLYNLEKLRLPTFSENNNLKQQYVSRMTLHSGIPTRTMNDYFRILSEQMAKDPELTAEDFTLWAQGRISKGTLYNVDVPVKQFIEFGKEFSVDLTDRCIELISKLGDSDDISADAALPPRFVQEATRLLQSGQIRGVSSRSDPVRAGRPKLILDPHTNIPSLYLPSYAVPDGVSNVVWSVAFGDEEAISVSVPSLWPGEPSLERIVPLPKPVRQATVDMNDSSYSMKTINFIDGADPTVFFDEAGAIIPKNVDLPSGNVWVLMPGRVEGLDLDAELRLLTSVQLPAGWEGWTLSLIDLESATYIIHVSNGTNRSVKSLNSAKILIDNPLTFVKTPTGAPVIASKPTIILPGDSEWEVVLMAGDGVEINKIKTSDGDSSESLWNNEPNGIVGERTIRIRGPLGRGTSRSFYIAEGLQESATQSFRKINTNGLDIASVKISTTPDIGVEMAVQFDSETTELPIAIASYRFVVSIPYASLSYGLSSTSIHPMTIFAEDIREEPSSLYFYTNEMSPAYFEVSSNGSVVQREANLVYRNGSYSFNLAKISETLSNYPYVTITFGEDKTKLAAIRPKSLFDDAILSPDRKDVLFTGCMNTAGLSAVFYSLSAPWITPQAAEVNESRCTIPYNLVDAGGLLVFLQIVDEWSGHSELPDWPSSEKIALIKNTGWYQAGSDEESAISAFLVGKKKTLPAHIENIELLWIVYARTVRLYENGLLGLADRYSIVAQINTALVRQVGDAFMAIAHSPLEKRMIPYVLISSGMIWSNINTRYDITMPDWSIRNALAASLLSGADHDWSDDELGAAIGTLGDTVMDVYNGKDPHLAIGGFGYEVDLMDSDSSRARPIIESLDLVPKGLLDADSRAKAALSVFTIRHDNRIQYMLDNTTRIIDNGRSILSKCAPKEVIDLLEHRLHPVSNVGWRGLPAASLSLALLARYASRDNEQAKNFFVVESKGDYIELRDLARQRDLDNQRNGWAEFAKLVPDTVSIDIILAEIVIAGAEKRKNFTK